ncbi:hypothetical protein ACVWXO_000018 [Bradyrhizobium sp. LM2.7]
MRRCSTALIQRAQHYVYFSDKLVYVRYKAGLNQNVRIRQNGIGQTRAD